MGRKNRIAVVVLSGLMMAAAGVGVGTTFAGPSADGDRPTSRPASRPSTRPGEERHPEIRRALMGLREVRHALEHADHDFDGHRADALKDVDAAIKECEDALKVDRK